MSPKVTFTRPPKVSSFVPYTIKVDGKPVGTLGKSELLGWVANFDADGVPFVYAETFKEAKYLATDNAIKAAAK